MSSEFTQTHGLAWLVIFCGSSNLQLWTCEVNSVDKRHITELLLLYFLSMSHFTKKILLITDQSRLQSTRMTNKGRMTCSISLLIGR